LKRLTYLPTAHCDSSAAQEIQFSQRGSKVWLEFEVEQFALVVITNDMVGSVLGLLLLRVTTVNANTLEKPPFVRVVLAARYNNPEIISAFYFVVKVFILHTPVVAYIVGVINIIPITFPIDKVVRYSILLATLASRFRN